MGMNKTDQGKRAIWQLNFFFGAKTQEEQYMLYTVQLWRVLPSIVQNSELYKWQRDRLLALQMKCWRSNGISRLDHVQKVVRVGMREKKWYNRNKTFNLVCIFEEDGRKQC